MIIIASAEALDESLLVEGFNELVHPTDLDIVTISGDGGVLLPCFSSTRSAASWAGVEVHVGALSGLALARIAIDQAMAGLIIDPRTNHELIFSRADLLMLLKNLQMHGSTIDD